MAALKAQLQADPDGRLRDHAQRWQQATGQPVCLWAVHRGCRALDWTHKKKLTASGKPRTTFLAQVHALMHPEKAAA